MPDIDKIKEFNKILNSLGSESKTSSKKEENVNDIPVPENPLDEDFKELLNSESPPQGDKKSLNPDFADIISGGDEDLASQETEATANLDILPMDFQDTENSANSDLAGADSDSFEASNDFLADIPLEPGVGETEEIPSIDLEDLFPTGNSGAAENSLPDEAADMPADFSKPDTDLAGTGETDDNVPFDIQLDTENYQLDSSPDSADTTPNPAREEHEPMDEGLADIDIPDIDFGPSLAADTEEDQGEGFAESSAEFSAQPPEDEFASTEDPSLDLSAFTLDDTKSDLTEENNAVPPADDFSLPDEFQLPDPGLDNLDSDISSSNDFSAPAFKDDFGGEGSGINPADKADEFPSDLMGGKDSTGESDDFLIDEFNLPEITDDIAGGGSAANKLNKGTEKLPSSISFKERVESKETEDDDDNISITEEQFKALQETLKGLPLNLKVTIEELIGNQGLMGEPLQNLLDYLITGRPPREIGLLVSRITGKKISLPKKFQKKTGVAFEEEKKSLGYAFRENIWPILRVIGPTLIIVLILAFGIHQFVVEPIRALSVYQKGYEYLQANRFQEANEKFDTALRIRPIKEQFFRYASAFTDKQQYEKAAEKYKHLLDQYPADKAGLLAWAGLESNWRKDHQKAEELLDHILKKDPSDYDALLASGDNYLAWALSQTGEKQAIYFEQSKESYFKILRTDKREKNEPWFHLLHFFIVTDNLGEVEKLKERFEADKDIKIDPVIYGELGGYLITKNHLDSVKDILTRALNANRELPETYYHFARYFRIIGNKSKEEESLVYARTYFDKKQPLTPDQIAMLINVHNWRGENYYIKDESLLAEQEYNAAINLIETTESKLSVPANGDFGKVYNNRGDLRYHFYDDLNLALKDYQQAEDFLYKSPALDYKIGRIQYIYEGYKESLLRFYQASKAFPHEPTILLAMANTYFNRDDYAAAQGEYLLLLDILEDELTHIPLLRPAENPTHKNLLTKLMVTHNNLGVTLKRQAEAPRNPRKETEALLHFTKASEYSDLLSRNPDTVKRGEALSFGYINTRALLYPISGNSLVLYHMLPKELKDGNWPTKPKTTE